MCNTVTLQLMAMEGSDRLFQDLTASSPTDPLVTTPTPPPPFRSPELPERARTFCRNVVIL